MNKAQKIASLIALAVFVLTLCNAPWDVARTSYQSTSHHQECSPIWNSPSAPFGGQATLQVGVLVVWWLGIAVIYTGLFFILKWKPAPKIGSQQPTSPPVVQSPADSPPAKPLKKGNVFSKRKIMWLVMVIVGLAISLLIFSAYHTATKKEAMRNCEILDAVLQPQGVVGFYDIVGRIRNNSTKAVSGLTLKVFIYAPYKTLIDTEPVALTFFPSLDPGDVKPFSQNLLSHSFPTNFTWAYSITDIDF